MYDVTEELLAKPWPPELVARFYEDQEPIILIIATNWEDFDPSHGDKFGVIFVSDFFTEPRQIRTVLQKLASLAKNDEDIFAWLRSFKDKEASREAADALLDFVELKPGIAIDIKAHPSSHAAPRPDVTVGRGRPPTPPIPGAVRVQALAVWPPRAWPAALTLWQVVAPTVDDQQVVLRASARTDRHAAAYRRLGFRGDPASGSPRCLHRPPRTH